MESILEAVGQDLADLSDPATRETASRFFKEPVRCRGVKTAAVHAVARDHWRDDRTPRQGADLRALRGPLPDRVPRGRLRRGRLGRLARAGVRARRHRGPRGLGRALRRQLGRVRHPLQPRRRRPRGAVPGDGRRRCWGGRCRRTGGCGGPRPSRSWSPRNGGSSSRTPSRSPTSSFATPTTWSARATAGSSRRRAAATATRSTRSCSRAASVMPRTALRYAIELMPPELRAEAMRKG